MVAAVLDVARRQLGEVGPAALSLRSIAREIGVVPSALYRYLPGREAILTELIRTGYERLGAAVVEAEAAQARDDHLGRWLATWRAVRAWALEHPHEYALLYGTPVVGYRAPDTTIRPALVVIITLSQIAVDAALGGAQPAPVPDPGAAVRADLGPIMTAGAELGITDPDAMGDDGLLLVFEAWTTLFGAISFELFGRYEGSIHARAEHVDSLATRSAERLGLTPRVSP